MTSIAEFLLLTTGIIIGLAALAFLVITAIWLIDDYWFAP